MPIKPSSPISLIASAGKTCSRSRAGRVGREFVHGEAPRHVADCRLLFGRDHAASRASAVASPPPMHSDATPRFRPYFSSAASSVTRMRAPEAPIGWPSAQAPPLHVDLLVRQCRVRASATMATTAKASLTSQRSTSSARQPALPSSFLIAPTGAVVNLAGSCGVGRVADDRRQRAQARASRPRARAS